MLTVSMYRRDTRPNFHKHCQGEPRESAPYAEIFWSKLDSENISDRNASPCQMWWKASHTGRYHNGAD